MKGGNVTRRLVFAVVFFIVLSASATLRAAPPSPFFFKTEDSDLWVSRTFDVQSKYRRVIRVGNTDPKSKVVRVHAYDLNARGQLPELVEYPVDLDFDTLQKAADAAMGGDIVAVCPGAYAGFELNDKPTACDGRYVVFKALGAIGSVTIDRPAEGKDPNWMIYLRGAHHVIIDGFNIAGATGPGLDPEGPRAGIFIDGDFGNTGLLAHHIVILSNFSHNHRSWGLHSTDSHSVLIQNNAMGLSCEEHCAYVSDGSDNYCIRGNVFFDSSASGLQCNLDPDASIAELMKHPEMKDYPDGEPSPERARAILALATAKFGENNFPDGRGLNFIIQDNIIHGNGKSGGGALNLAGLQDSLIQNNIIYANFATGIAAWDNANSYDAPLVDPGPSSAQDVKGPESLPLWGCRGNIIRNNTVIMDNPGRSAMLLNNGSWGCTLRNNIFINDSSWSIDGTATSALRLDSGYNVVNATRIPTPFIELTTAIDENNLSSMGVRCKDVADEFARFGDQPWVLVEGSWWKLNPERPDFRPVRKSRLLRGKGDPRCLPLFGMGHVRRAGADVGACAAMTSEAK